MARSKYEFIKIEMRLFDDPRFYMLTEFGQLSVVKLLAFAKRTDNQIPKDREAIRLFFKTNRSATEVESVVNRIKETFNFFKENKYFFYFDGYTERYGYGGIKKRGNGGVEEEKEKEEDKEKEYLGTFYPSLKDFPSLWQAWCAYEDMRRKIKKPLTDHAKELVVKKLTKYDAQTAQAMLEQSVLNNWQGVFPLKNDNNGKRYL